MVEFIKTHPDNIFELGIHTVTRGDDRYNLKLSQKRAQSLREYLLSEDVDSNSFITIGFGETKPVVEYEDIQKLKDTHRCGNYNIGNRQISLVVLK